MKKRFKYNSKTLRNVELFSFRESFLSVLLHPFTDKEVHGRGIVQSQKGAEPLLTQLHPPGHTPEAMPTQSKHLFKQYLSRNRLILPVFF